MMSEGRKYDVPKGLGMRGWMAFHAWMLAL